MNDIQVGSQEGSDRPSRLRAKLFGPKLMRVRRRMLVRRNISDVLSTVTSFDELTSTFRFLYFRDEKTPPRRDVSLFSSEESGRKGLDLIGVKTDNGIVFRTAPRSLSELDGEVTCRAVDAMTTEVRLALGFIHPLKGVRALSAPLIKPTLETVVRDELRRLKQFLETGEIAKAA